MKESRSLASRPPASRRSMVPSPVARSHEVLAFALGSEQFAIKLGTVREILIVPSITEVPRAPRYVLGVVSVRGRITTVIDLRRRMGLEEPPLTKHARILLVAHQEEVIGLLVDRVLQVFRLRDDEIEPAASTATDTSDYVIGIGRPRSARAERGPAVVADQTLLVLIDPEPLLRRS